MTRFIPSYTGGKTRWVDRLEPLLTGRDIIEPFCGGASLSAAHAKTAHLNDNDEYITKYLNHFDELEVPEVFTLEDYFRVRCQPDWWRWLFCLQSMAFSGVYRWTMKSGFNVPPKKNRSEISVRPQYEAALVRWSELRPTVTCGSYIDIPHESYVGKTVVVDPPYEKSWTKYNSGFDFAEYWQWLERVTQVAERVVVFDRLEHLVENGIEVFAERKMRVNGAYQGAVEAVGVIDAK